MKLIKILLFLLTPAWCFSMETAISSCPSNFDYPRLLAYTLGTTGIVCIAASSIKMIFQDPCVIINASDDDDTVKMHSGSTITMKSETIPSYNQSTTMVGSSVQASKKEIVKMHAKTRLLPFDFFNNIALASLGISTLMLSLYSYKLGTS